MVSIASEAMNVGSLPKALMAPVTQPQAAPTSRPITMLKPSGSPEVVTQ